jgi:hypothetical protein
MLPHHGVGRPGPWQAGIHPREPTGWRRVASEQINDVIRLVPGMLVNLLARAVGVVDAVRVGVPLGGSHGGIHGEPNLLAVAECGAALRHPDGTAVLLEVVGQDVVQAAFGEGRDREGRVAGGR